MLVVIQGLDAYQVQRLVVCRQPGIIAPRFEPFAREPHVIDP